MQLYGPERNMAVRTCAFPVFSYDLKSKFEFQRLILTKEALVSTRRDGSMLLWDLKS